jgi:hypothetical protein
MLCRPVSTSSLEPQVAVATDGGIELILILPV